MTEPPAKRAKRTDSAAMWEENDSPVDGDPRRAPEKSQGSKRRETTDDNGSNSKDKRHHEGRRNGGRRQSRSRERKHNHRDRSRSLERGAQDRDRDREKAGIRNGRDSRDHENRASRRHRERSKSPVRHRSSKDLRPDRDREHPRRRSRTRSRSPIRNGRGIHTGTRSPPRAPRSGRGPADNLVAAHGKEHSALPTKSKTGPAFDDAMQIDSKLNGHKGKEADEDSEDALLRKMMGFSTFKTTQNKKIPGNNVSGVRKEKSTKYRQYMNRTGGFNRPLSPSRD